MEYKQLTRNPGINKTKIYAGHSAFTPQQLDEEMKIDSEIGKKLKRVEKILDQY